MVLPGDRVHLKGKTGKGKSRVGQYGEWWLVSNEHQWQFDTSPLVWVEVTGQRWSGRWLNLDKDEHFEILEVAHGQA